MPQAWITSQSLGNGEFAGRCANYVWDPVGLSWVVMTQPGGGGGGGAATIADGADVAQGATTDAESAAGNGSVVALLKRIRTLLASPLAVSGPLTDTQLRASAVPVTANAGTNLNTSALALDATLTGGTQKAIARGAAKGTTVAADVTSNPVDANTQALHVDGSKVTQPVSLATNTPDVTDRVGRLLGIIASITAAVDVSDRAARLVGVVYGSQAQQLKQTATNFNLQSELAVGGALIDPRSVRALTNADVVTAELSKWIGSAAPTVGQKVMASSLPIAIASDQSAVPVTAPTLTKGTQSANGFSVQELRDAGRNARIFMLDTITAAPVAEALATVVQWYSNAAVAGTTQPAVVPAGKTLRLISWKIQYQSLATVGYAVVRIRANTGGLVVIGSPLVASFEAGTNSGATTTAVTGAVTLSSGDFPEGLELPAGTGIGFSVAGYGPTGTLTLEGGVRFMVVAYEY